MFCNRQSPLFGKDKIKILFLRPPYHLWPIINESDNFLLPLAYPCLGAYLKQKMRGVEIKVIDCLPLRIGWKSLRRIIAEENPDVVGVGDKVCYMHEGIKALKMAKEVRPDVITIAGGHFHSHLPKYSLEHFPDLDYIVRFEGERTLHELLDALREGKNLSKVESISYRENGSVVMTPPRALVENLDDLPFPDYDLMPIKKYAPFGKLWPRAITIQGSRGCPYDCNFCSWSATEGEHKLVDGKEVLIPRLRQKSVTRVINEIDYLYKKYGVRYLFWVEGTWNYDHQWLDELCEEIIKKGYNLGWWAFVRADLMLEQEKKGILEKMVRAGFRHALIGGERAVDGELACIGKTEQRASYLKEVCWLLERKYPQVFRQSTLITGIRSENEESIKQLGKFSRDAHLDFAAFHPLEPWPGTPLWEEANQKGWIEERDFSNYDMFFPVMPSEHLSREKISQLTHKLYTDFVGKQPLRYIKGLFSIYPIRRRLHWWFLFSITRVLLRDLMLSMLGKKKFEGFAATNRLWKPKWYDS
ncbi:MAG: cobalamin-dependent protein [Candidatus Omnitrophica bacterium]|nr:cobalamin-dependent protein [Candidatus Omnitrophota bacterium]